MIRFFQRLFRKPSFKSVLEDITNDIDKIGSSNNLKEDCLRIMSVIENASKLTALLDDSNLNASDKEKVAGLIQSIIKTSKRFEYYLRAKIDNPMALYKNEAGYSSMDVQIYLTSFDDKFEPVVEAVMGLNDFMRRK